MSKAERIKRIERALFVMEFKDHWTANDWAEKNALENELAELKA